MARREKLFFVLASVFVSSLVMANIIGLTKFFEFRVPLWGYTVMVPVGILPYPVTFLATDLICELYGRRRANFIIFVGFLMNVFLIAVCGLGHWFDDSTVWQSQLEEPWHDQVYPRMWGFVWIGVQGSMAAYLVAQFVDVQLFHLWKKVTRGKHFWLRNNASTMCSQLIDTTIITLYVFAGSAAEGKIEVASPFGDGMVGGYASLLVLIFNSYLFKFFFALFDTPLAYLFRRLLKPYVGDMDPGEVKYDGG